MTGEAVPLTAEDLDHIKGLIARGSYDVLTWIVDLEKQARAALDLAAQVELLKLGDENWEEILAEHTKAAYQAGVEDTAAQVAQARREVLAEVADTLIATAQVYREQGDAKTARVLEIVAQLYPDALATPEAPHD